MWTNKDKKQSVDITINLDNGLYVLDTDSAVGKTRLTNLIKLLETYKEPVVGYTYNDYLENKYDFREYLDRKNPKVIILDRYDMYFEEYKDVLEKWRNKAIVLVDSKYSGYSYVVPQDDDMVIIEMTETSITVDRY